MKNWRLETGAKDCIDSLVNEIDALEKQVDELTDQVDELQFNLTERDNQIADLEEEKAAELIMKAREPWFTD